MSKLGGKSDLASAKAEIDKIYVGKLKTVPIDLSKLSSFSYARNAIFICIFWKKIIFSFLTEGQFHVCRKKKYHLYRIYRKHIYLYFFLRKIIFHFPPRKNIIFSRKRNATFSDVTRKIIFQSDFFGKTIFSEHLKNISYLHVFFEKDHLSFST